MVKIEVEYNSKRRDFTDYFMKCVKEDHLSMVEFCFNVKENFDVDNIYVTDDQLKREWKMY